MGGMLWPSRGGMMEALQGTIDVPWHGEVDGALGVVPAETETAIPGGVPILGDLILLPQGGQEMHGIIAGGVPNSKIVYDQGEADIPGGVAP